MGHRDDDTLRAAFATLEAERARTWPPARLAANLAQRRTLIERLEARQTVKVGDTLEDIDLIGLDGAPLSLATLAADGLAVLILFRFATCGADMIALPHYDRTLRPALARIGVPVVAISPQVPDRLGAIVEAHRLTLEVSSDPDNRLARRLGVTFVPDDRPSPPPADWVGAVTGTRSWELPMPTVVVVDATLAVRFVAISPDWLDRPEAAAIVAAVTAIHAGDAAAPVRDAAAPVRDAA